MFLGAVTAFQRLSTYENARAVSISPTEDAVASPGAVAVAVIADPATVVEKDEGQSATGTACGWIMLLLRGEVEMPSTYGLGAPRLNAALAKQ